MVGPDGEGAPAAAVARGQSLSRALLTAGAPLDRVDLALLEAGEAGEVSFWVPSAKLT